MNLKPSKANSFGGFFVDFTMKGTLNIDWE